MNKWVVNIDTGAKFDIYVGRGSKFGNPFSHLPNSAAPFPVDTREEAIQAFEVWLLEQPELVAAVKKELRQKILGCHCLPLSCHAEVLARIANE
jgi:Domain of unknown function (DUF4326)